jgi:hypothetical protein
MSQRHLYGLNYQEMTPPAEWESITIDATINDSTFEASIDTNTFTFVGETATFITAWIAQYGVFNGLPYRIEIFEGTTTTIVFDGFIVLSEKQQMSVTGPNIIVAPVRALNNNVSVIDQMGIVTQGLLLKQGWIQFSDFVDIPVVIVNKKTVQERIIMFKSLVNEIITFFVNSIQDFISAISDIIGVSLPLGLIELGVLIVQVVLGIKRIKLLIQDYKDLLFAHEYFYKGIGIKTVLEKLAAKFGYTFDFGIIETQLSKEYVLPSNNGWTGHSSPGQFAIGIQKPVDFGYQGTEMLQIVEQKFNTRIHVENGVIHMKTKSDPFWTSSPLYQPDNLVVETTKQHTNGNYRDKTEDVHSTVFINYQYDPSDGWTLTEKTGDSYEIHRELITELNPKMNTLKGFKEVAIPWVMGVRYNQVESLFQLLQDSFSQFNTFLGKLQSQLTYNAASVDPNAGANGGISTILGEGVLILVFNINAGGIKVEDNTWAIPKSVYGDIINGAVRMPSNFKNFIGAEAIYNNWYFPLSPAIENGFKGQYKLIESYQIRFGLDNYLQTKSNPYFLLNTKNAKFTNISWNENDRNAQTQIEIQDPFDTNIKEIEI